MREKNTLHCYCCGDAYERGHFKCCAPPSGMASHTWLEQFCVKCGTPTRRNCPKEAKPPATIEQFDNIAKIAERFMNGDPEPERKAAKREWTPYAAEREAGAEE